MIEQIILLVSRVPSRPPIAIVLPAIALIVFIVLVAGPTTIAATSQPRSGSNSEVTAQQLKLTPIHEILLAPGSQPLGITIGPNGNVWFAENNSTKIVEYNPENQTSKSYPIPMKEPSLIWFLVFDPNGNLWFSNQLQPYLWRFSPTTGQFANFTTGGQNTDAFGLVYDNFTNQIWFTSPYTNQIGYFNLHGKNATLGMLINESVVPISYSLRFGPAGLAVGSNGDIYVSQPFSADIVKYNPSMHNFVKVWNLQPHTQAVGIGLSSNERVWFANDASSLLGYVDQNSSQSTEFATSLFASSGGTVSQPYWVAIAPNGAVWFDEYASNKIARYTPSTGALTEFAIPTNHSTPLRFVIDNERHVIWFTEFSGDKLGEINENTICNCSVQLSSRNLTLSSGSVSFYLKYVPPNNQSLNHNSPAPLISGTFQRNAQLTGNLSTSAVVVNSSFYRITLTRGPDLNPGNYSITVCPRPTTLDNSSSPAPVRQCATSQVAVLGHNSTISTTSSLSHAFNLRAQEPTLLILAAAASVGFFNFFLRRRNKNKGTS